MGEKRAKTLTERLSEKWSGSGDYVTPWEALCGLVKARVITRDEARQELGLEPLDPEWGNKEVVLERVESPDGRVVARVADFKPGSPERMDEIDALRRENTRLQAELDAAKSALAHAKNAIC